MSVATLDYSECMLSAACTSDERIAIIRLEIYHPSKQKAEINIPYSGSLSLHCLPSLVFCDSSDILSV